MRVSIAVPSLATVYLNYLLRALRSQSIRSSEVVIVVKGDAKAVEELCGKLTRDLNKGKRG